MSATTVMLAAFGVVIIGRWAHNQPTVTPKSVVQGVFALIVIAALDSGDTQPIARGFAWLFLIAGLLGQNSPLNALQNVK